MTSSGRLTGAFFVLFGLAVYFLIIPAYVEQVDGGNLAPNTLPNAVSIVIAVCGALLMLKPTAHEPPNGRYFAAAAVYVAVLGAAIYAMSWFGFVYVASILALILMLMIGERRPLWLAAGVVVIPGRHLAFRRPAARPGFVVSHD